MRLDDFEDVSAWMPVASGLAELKIASEPAPNGRSMRLDFDFHGGGGFVVARRPMSIALPEAYELRFEIRGAAPSNKLEIKLSDPSGRNVWWYHQDAFDFPDAWRPMRIRSSQIEFAWGPAGGGALCELGAIEIAIAAGPGGRGTVWIGDLQLEDRTPRAAPVVRASSAVAGHAPASVLDRSTETSWRSASAERPEWLSIDLQSERECGGLVIEWERAGRARRFDVETSGDGLSWTTVWSATQADAERSYVYLPGIECRHLRLALHESVEGGAFGIAAIEVKPYLFSRSMHDFFHAVAADAPRGSYPKYFYREQTYWTPVGVPDGETCALLNEEGMVEVDRGTFSIEPFLWTETGLVTWADGDPVQELEKRYLPIPSSVWRAGTIVLTTTAFAVRRNGRPILYVRYRVENGGTEARRLRLFAACRPFQVTPPWQAFGSLGGVGPIRQLEYVDRVVRLNDDRAVVALDEPDGFGAAAFEQGAIADHLRAGELPSRQAVIDDFGCAWGALRFDLDLEPSAVRDVHLAIPFGSADAAAARDLVADVVAEAELAHSIRQWEAKLDRIDVRLPAGASAAVDTLKTAIAHVLIQRDGPALQPGPRRYTRSWIRDGAIMAAALLRVGCAEEAQEFVRWYAPYQRDDGFVPCCVDRGGPDWLVEHDSHGQLVFAAMECFRFTADRAFLAEMWPAAAKAVAHLEALRETRLTPEFDAPEKRAFRGLLPESASHEGYLAHPVHAYWDDFWAVRALADAAEMAGVLGHSFEARRFAELAQSFGDSLYASIEATIAARAISYLPGSVEWADFDPTATSNAIALLGETERLPRAALEETFTEYLRGFRRRRGNEIDWSNYTPYEVRIVGALVRLGRRADAYELADFLLGDRRPLAWNQWPEIAWRDPQSPGHIGDVPHAWIGAEYVLSFLGMLAFERRADDALVIGAGVPPEWLSDDGGIAVRDLPTVHGKLSFSLRRAGDDALELSVSGSFEKPPARIVVEPPLPRPLVAVEIDGVPVTAFEARSVALRAWPARVLLRF